MTEQEIKELWEWCGFEIWDNPFGLYVKFPDELRALHVDQSIDLDNLFKYAVPKITDLETYTLVMTVRQGITNVSIMPNYQGKEKGSYTWGKDPAEALAKAILEVIKDERD
jgi:hypothetical protein